ncbi:hypothetical protein BGX38DRAFT_352682 [Terfezia claveryi]|nr:hypothetical protein BGX38DRAFT_352682 [Terfezia claveryi]
MSATSLPITPEAFLAALENLSISQLRLESHRLLNSIYHLRRSNITLLSDDFASDPDCQDAVRENEEVIRRQEERVAMIRSEVERRGFRMEHWVLGEELGGDAVGGATNGVVNGLDNGEVVVGREGESSIQGNLSVGGDTEVVREVGVEGVQGAVTSVEPPSQRRELDPLNHPSPAGIEDDGVYL